jgi:hypothetical protein
MRFRSRLHPRSGHEAFTFAWLAAIQRQTRGQDAAKLTKPVSDAPAKRAS